MSEQAQNPYLRLAAAVVLTAARDARKGKIYAARWLASDDGLFFGEACGFDTEQERWANAQVKKLVNRRTKPDSC